MIKRRNINVVVGQKIRELRLDQGLTQKELAKEAGVDARSIRAIEAAMANPALSTLTQIADALGVDPKVLFEK